MMILAKYRIASLAVLLLLALAFLPGSARALSNVNVYQSNDLTNSEGAYAVYLTIGLTHSLTSIAITFPAGFSFSSSSIYLIYSVGLPAGWTSVSGQTITYVFKAAQTLMGGRLICMTIGGIRAPNISPTPPATSKSYTVTITTFSGLTAIETGTSNAFSVRQITGQDIATSSLLTISSALLNCAYGTFSGSCLTVTGLTVLNGPTTAQDIVPAASGLYDLGSSLAIWNNLYVNAISANQLKLTGSPALITATSGLTINTNSGDLYLSGYNSAILNAGSTGEVDIRVNGATPGVARFGNDIIMSPAAGTFRVTNGNFQVASTGSIYLGPGASLNFGTSASAYTAISFGDNNKAAIGSVGNVAGVVWTNIVASDSTSALILQQGTNVNRAITVGSGYNTVIFGSLLTTLSTSLTTLTCSACVSSADLNGPVVTGLSSPLGSISVTWASGVNPATIDLALGHTDTWTVVQNFNGGISTTSGDLTLAATSGSAVILAPGGTTEFSVGNCPYSHCDAWVPSSEGIATDYLMSSTGSGVIATANDIVAATGGSQSLGTSGQYFHYLYVNAIQGEGLSPTLIGFSIPWSDLTSFPAACGAGKFVTAVGSTLTCALPSSTVTSVSSADNTLIISPTTGAVKASLNLGNTNTWTVVQDFGGGIGIGNGQSLTFGTAGSITFSDNGVATIGGADNAAAYLFSNAVVSADSHVLFLGGGTINPRQEIVIGNGANIELTDTSGTSAGAFFTFTSAGASLSSSEDLVLGAVGNVIVFPGSTFEVITGNFQVTNGGAVTANGLISAHAGISVADGKSIAFGTGASITFGDSFASIGDTTNSLANLFVNTITAEGTTPTIQGFNIMSSTLDWSELTDFPSACAANEYVTDIGSGTCTGLPSNLAYLNTGNTWSGTQDFTSATLAFGTSKIATLGDDIVVTPGSSGTFLITAGNFTVDSKGNIHAHNIFADGSGDLVISGRLQLWGNGPIPGGNGIISVYHGIYTAGTGVPAIYAEANVNATSASTLPLTVTSYAVPAGGHAGVFLVGCTVASNGAYTFSSAATCKATWTDVNGNAQYRNLSDLGSSNAATSDQVFVISVPPGTTVTIQLTGTITGGQVNAYGFIAQIG